MYGRCVECGTTIDWRDVFTSPRCDGLVEHALGIRQWAWWGIRTSVAILWPRRFWSRVEARHELKLGRAFFWFVLPIVLWLLPSLWRAFNTFVAESVHYWEMSGPEWATAYAYKQAYDIVRRDVPELTWWFWPYVAMALTTPVLLLWLSQMRYEDDLSVAQMARCAFYGLVVGVVVWLIEVWWYRMAFAVENLVISRRPAAASYVEVIRMWQLHDFPGHVLLGAWLLFWNWYAVSEGIRVRRAFRVWGVLSVSRAALSSSHCESTEP